MLDTFVQYLRSIDEDLVIVLLGAVTITAVISLVINLLQWLGKRKIKKAHTLMMEDFADVKGELSGLKKVNQVTIDTILKRLDGYMMIIQAALNIRTGVKQGPVPAEELYAGPRDEAGNPDEDWGADQETARRAQAIEQALQEKTKD